MSTPGRYEVTFEPGVERQLRKLPTTVRERIVRAAEGLADNPRPHGYVKLTGPDELYRIRVGDYRIVYQIEDDRLIVLVVRIGNRKDIYREGG